MSQSTTKSTPTKVLLYKRKMKFNKHRTIRRAVDGFWEDPDCELEISWQKVCERVMFDVASRRRSVNVLEQNCQL